MSNNIIINQDYSIDRSKKPKGITLKQIDKVLDWINYKEKFIAFKLQQEFVKKLIQENKELKDKIKEGKL